MARPDLIVDRVAVEELAPNTHHRLRLRIDGPAAEVAPFLPVDVLVGRGPRPCLALVGGVHGDEYDGIVALQEIAREIEPTQLDGSLLLVYVANPFAFAARQRRTPDDGRDLNRTFPGDPRGSVSERLAHLLCHGLLRQTELIFTLHGALATDLLAPWIEYLDVPGPIGEASRAAALASGFADLIALDPRPGRLITAMADLGVPLVEGEVGGRGAARREGVDYYKERVRAVARHRGILPARDPGADAPRRQRTWKLETVAAPAGGIFFREVEPDQEVRAGDLLGRIVAADGEAVAEARAPVAGKVGACRDHAGVAAGDSLVTLWRPVGSPA
jgi:predicted deacylase